MEDDGTVALLHRNSETAVSLFVMMREILFVVSTEGSIVSGIIYRLLET